MKTRYKVNILFFINVILVGILSLGAAYFTIGPLLMGFTEPHRIVSVVTQNHAMIGLWLIYFASIVFLPITFKKRDRKQIIAFGIFVAGIVIFVLLITGVFSCWEAGILKFFGLDYNARLRC